MEKSNSWSQNLRPRLKALFYREGEGGGWGGAGDPNPIQKGLGFRVLGF